MVRSTLVAYKLLEAVYRSAEFEECDLVYLLIAEGNNQVEQILKGRAIFPPFTKFSTFHVYQLKSRSSYKSSINMINQEYAPDLTLSGSYREMLSFFDSSNAKQSNDYNTHRRTLIVRDRDKVLAYAHLIDTKFCKQNVVIDMPLHLKIGIGTMRLLTNIFSLGRFPWIDESIDMISVESFDFQKSDRGKSAFLNLLNFASNMVFQMGYHFLSIAVDERDPADAQIKSLPHYLFKSNLFIHCKENKVDLVQNINCTKMNFAIV